MKQKIVLLFLALCLALNVCAYAQPVDETAVYESAAYVVETPAAGTVASAEELPWNLVLVNADHAVPEDWECILMDLSNGRKIDRRMYPELQKMFDDCRAAGLKIMVNSGYRSYEDQKSILVNRYNRYKNQGMTTEQAQAEALKWVAYPGYSEHHTGIAVDITSSNTEACSNDRTWAWLKENCAKYGFIWRYPGTKTHITGISDEPWHFRYVGVEAATYIMEKGICFEEYLFEMYGIPYQQDVLENAG